jgi:type I restriction enzyme S subunit
MFGDPVTNEKGWEVKKFGEVCDINPKKSEISDVERNTYVSFVPMAKVGEKGELELTENRRLSDVISGFTYFKDNDVLFAKITPCMENGKGTIATGLKNGIGFGSTEFHVLRPKKTVNSEYIYAITSKSDFRNEAERNMTGSAGQKRVPKEFFLQYKIPVPEINIQNHFAAQIKSIKKQKAIINLSIAEVQQLFDYTMDKYFN